MFSLQTTPLATLYILVTSEINCMQHQVTTGGVERRKLEVNSQIFRRFLQVDHRGPDLAAKFCRALNLPVHISSEVGSLN